MGVPFYNFNHFTIPVNKFLESPTGVKNANISMREFLFKKNINDITDST